MADYRDTIPMLSNTSSQSTDEFVDVELQRFNIRRTTRIASMPISRNVSSYESENNFISHRGPFRDIKSAISGPININQRPESSFQPIHRILGTKVAMDTIEELSSVNETCQDRLGDNYVTKNEHLMKSGSLGRCDDPYCTTCPMIYTQEAKRKNSKASVVFKNKFHNALYWDAKGWVRRSFFSPLSWIPGVMNPHTKFVQRWNKFFVISCVVAIFMDPLYFFLVAVEKERKCLAFNWPMATGVSVMRSVTDFFYFLHMLLQFRLAYVAPESRVVGMGILVDHPKRIALHYLRGYFLLDLFIVLPLPQILILLVLPKYTLSAASHAKTQATVLLQCIPRIFRFLPLLAGQTATGFLFESLWANFVVNLLVFVLAGHVVGSCWYLFGLQRVNHCLRDACSVSMIKHCKEFIDCGHGKISEQFNGNPDWTEWLNYLNATSTNCFDIEKMSFSYGIYKQAVLISSMPSTVTRYSYSFLWGFQQISTLASNLVPSSFQLEILFTIHIVAVGLLLFPLVIGNMQNFLHALGRRRLEMQLRRSDVEQWMSHRRLPNDLRRQVRQYERFTWAALRGVNEELLLENLPEDLQRNIRRHLFKVTEKVRIFALLDETILDAIFERLRPKFYIGGSQILHRGGPINKMIFIVRGKMKSTGGDEDVVSLSEGDVCGEELLTWCLEHSSMNKDGKKIRLHGQRLLSNRTVKCVTNLEAFALRAADLEELAALFAKFLQNPRVHGAIRYESPYWRALAATRIQVAWRYRQKRLRRLHSLNSRINHFTR